MVSIQTGGMNVGEGKIKYKKKCDVKENMCEAAEQTCIMQLNQ